YLFNAQPNTDGSGNIYFNAVPDQRGAWTNWKADIQYCRQTQKRKMILSVGGAGNAISFPSRAKSQTFVTSVTGLIDSWGGLDGLDWDSYESQTPDTNEMIWISQQLKNKYGSGFLI